MAASDVTAAVAPGHSASARMNKHKADWRGWKFMWPFAVVLVFVFIIPLVIAFLCLQKYWQSGFAAVAVKE